jgi:hypothetical protein
VEPGDRRAEQPTKESGDAPGPPHAAPPSVRARTSAGVRSGAATIDARERAPRPSTSIRSRYPTRKGDRSGRRASGSVAENRAASRARRLPRSRTPMCRGLSEVGSEPSPGSSLSTSKSGPSRSRPRSSDPSRPGGRSGSSRPLPTTNSRTPSKVARPAESCFGSAGSCARGRSARCRPRPRRGPTRDPLSSKPAWSFKGSGCQEEVRPYNPRQGPRECGQPRGRGSPSAPWGSVCGLRIGVRSGVAPDPPIRPFSVRGV